MSWFKKKPLPSKKIPIHVITNNTYFPYAINLKCGCNYNWVEKTSQTILYPSYDCPEGHRAEITENVSKEDWENLLKVNNALGPKNEFIGMEGTGSWNPIIIHKTTGGNAS